MRGWMELSGPTFPRKGGPMHDAELVVLIVRLILVLAGKLMLAIN
jgi:hypothetical protein